MTCSLLFYSSFKIHVNCGVVFTQNMDVHPESLFQTPFSILLFTSLQRSLIHQCPIHTMSLCCMCNLTKFNSNLWIHGFSPSSLFVSSIGLSFIFCVLCKVQNSADAPNESLKSSSFKEFAKSWIHKVCKFPCLLATV